MPGHHGGIWRGAQGPPPPPQVLGAASDGGVGGVLLQRTLQRRERCDTGGTTITHHIQCGGGCGGLPLGFLGSGTGRGGQQQRHKLRGAASGEDNMVKVKRPMAGVGGA